MTTPDQAPGETPANEPTVTPTAGETPQPTGDPADFDNYSADELLEGITGNHAEKAPETPEPAKAEEGKPEEQKGKSLRLRLNALPQEQQEETKQALQLVREGEAKDLVEAIQQIRGTAEPEPQTPEANPESNPEELEADKPEEQPEPTQTGKVADLQKRYDELCEQRRDANKEFETERADELQAEIDQVIIDLQDAKIEAKQAEQQSEQAKAKEEADKEKWDNDYLEAVKRVESKYPDVLDDDSAFTQLLADRIEAAQARGDSRLTDPNYIEAFAEEIAAVLPKKPSGVPPSDPPAQARRATGTQVAPAQSQTDRPTKDQIAARIDESSPEELLAAIT